MMKKILILLICLSLLSCNVDYRHTRQNTYIRGKIKEISFQPRTDGGRSVYVNIILENGDIYRFYDMDNLNKTYYGNLNQIMEIEYNHSEQKLLYIRQYLPKQEENE